MIFELLHAPYPDGYGEAILPLQACKNHLRVDDDDDDLLVEALRDVSIEFVERYCGVKMGLTTGLVWRAQGFPLAPDCPLNLSVSPVVEITAVNWEDRQGEPVAGSPSDFRVSPSGSLLPKVGARWPVAVGGEVRIEFSAGFVVAPPSLTAAARLFLGHLFKNREAVTDRGIEGEMPFGVRQLCAPFRPVTI